MRRLMNENIAMITKCDDRLGREGGPGQVEQVIMNWW